MHNKPQISCPGEWGDASIVEDINGRLNYHCRYCRHFQTRIENRIVVHIIECRKRYDNLKENIDYLICKICNRHCQKLTPHIEMFHKDISIEEYRQLYGNILICQKLSQKCRDIMLNRGGISWQKQAELDGIDLTEYYKEMGKKISETIMSNPKERERRSNMMKELNSTVFSSDEIRKIYSETAKLTSSRPDIQEERSNRLKKWRENNPTDFKEKCTDKMLAAKPDKPTWFSKPEKILFGLLNNIENFSFRFNQVVKSNLFDWASKRKQVDIADKNNKIYIEFDGPFHFKLFNSNGISKLNEVKRRDLLLNEFIINNNFMLIRISYDQFKDKKDKGGLFKQECLDRLFYLINNFQPGVFFIGEEYGKY